MVKKKPFDLFQSLIKQGFVTPLDPVSTKKAVGLKMKAPGKSPHAQIAEELISIQQRNSKGFRVFDFSPFNFPRTDFYPTIDKNYLYDLLGPEAVTIASGLYEDGTNVVSDLPYWRTVEIPVQGNFLKIEFLPVRQNEVWASWDSTLPAQIPDNTSVTDNSDSFTLFSPKHSTDKFFFLSFQDNQGNQIIAKHGDVFKTEFSSFFLTFKTTIPRFRITIGYNSQVEAVDDRHANMQIAYGPGHGVFNNPQVNPVAFEITDKDLNGFQNTTPGTGFGYFYVTGGSTFEADLITNVPRILNRCYKAGGANSDLQLAQYSAAANYQFTNDATSAACAISGGAWTADNFQNNGMIIGWITHFLGNISLTSDAAFTSQMMVDLTLEIYRYTASGASGTPVRRLLTIPVTLDGIMNHQQFNVPLREPVRFCLMQRDALRLFITNKPTNVLSSKTIYCKFAAGGYTLGGLYGHGTNAGFPACPFDAYHKFTENPYPMDQQFGGPRY